MLARESRAGNLVAVVMPDERDEAIRDLSRTREDVLAARLRAHQQMKALLLRHGRACPSRIPWSPAHERNLSTIRLPYPAQEIASVEYRNAIKDAHERLERVIQALRLQSSRGACARHQGSITKAGNKHALRILIESAWTYCHSPRVGRELEDRLDGRRQMSGNVHVRICERLG